MLMGNRAEDMGKLQPSNDYGLESRWLLPEKPSNKVVIVFATSLGLNPDSQLREFYVILFLTQT